jgi:hypothetical protein
MFQLYALQAADLARDRTREAQQHRLAHLARSGRPDARSRGRRLAAEALASVSRAAAALVRRLDGSVAEDRPLGSPRAADEDARRVVRTPSA